VNIHQMNGLKNWGGTCINLVAVAIFAVSGIVSWPIALVMAAGAAVGGYVGSGLAQRVEQRTVRQLIIVIGLASGVWLLVQLSPAIDSGMARPPGSGVSLRPPR